MHDTIGGGNMPSKYGFETPGDLAKDREELKRICDEIDETLRDIVDDYLQTFTTRYQLNFVRQPDDTAWWVNNDRTPGGQFLLSINLSYRPVGEKSPQFFIALYAKMAAHTRNTLRLIDVIKREFNFPVQLKPIEVEDDDDLSALRQAQLWP